MWHAQPLERGCRRVWQPPLPAIYRTIRPLYLTSRLAPRLPRIYIAPFRPQFTSGYQVLAGERRACKFMRDAVHCFRQEGGIGGESRGKIDRDLSREGGGGRVSFEKHFFCFPATRVARRFVKFIFRKWRIPKMEAAIY